MASGDKAVRRSAHRTQWAAQFAVASELCKKDYRVAFTMGNHPSVDLMVDSPSGAAFQVDVKGLYKPNFWTVKPKPAKNGLFYILAYVPDNSANDFFILTQEEANAEVAAQDEKSARLALAKGRTAQLAPFPCIGWREAERYRGRWETLPT